MTTMSRRLACWALGLTVLVGACGGSKAAAPPASTTTAAQVTSARQAASIVARYKSTIEDAIAYDENCSSIDCLAAQARYSRGTKDVQTIYELHNALKGAEPVESEVSALTDRTISDLTAAEQAWQKFDACVTRTQSTDGCEQEDRDQELRRRDIKASLDAWAPYL